MRTIRLLDLAVYWCARRTTAPSWAPSTSRAVPSCRTTNWHRLAHPAGLPDTLGDSLPPVQLGAAAGQDTKLILSQSKTAHTTGLFGYKFNGDGKKRSVCA
jgi:hypothetical protein